MFCLWQPKNSIGAYLVNEPGTLCWNELMTSDVDAALPFYEKLFGWKRNRVTAGEVEYNELQLDGRGVGGAMASPVAGMPAVWGVYFAVDDCDKAVETASANGGTVLHEPLDIQPGRFAVLADPAGAVFNVLELTEPGD
jgi:predicted enzyme related to lactoylglutathione lyase